MAVCRNCEAVLEPKKFTCMRCGAVTLVETGNIGAVDESKTTTLDLVDPIAIERIVTGGPWDEVWGGGFVPTSLTLVGGSAGMGKSTIMLQILSRFAQMSGRRAYFLSAEQSAGEVRLTADRLGIPNPDRFRVLSAFGAGADVDKSLLKKDPPCAIVVDSVSALCGKDAHAAVAVSRNIKKLVVEQKAVGFLICHMNKAGDFAGLYTLQHDVDTLVTVFGEDNEHVLGALLKKGHTAETVDGLRVLTAWKNRYGPTGKDFHLTMTSHGLAPLPELLEKEKRSRKALITDLAKEPPPRTKTPVAPAPETITVAGQTLVRRKGATALKAAVEGEALKKKRAAVPRTKEGRLGAVERRKEGAR